MPSELQGAAGDCKSPGLMFMPGSIPGGGTKFKIHKNQLVCVQKFS